MNPFCPYDNTLLRQKGDYWKCVHCGQKWKKGYDVIMQTEEADPILFLRRIFKVLQL